MNKEIKFRLFDIKDKNMYFVTLDELLFYDGNYYSTGGESKDEFIKMQYTGLKDKNGKEIYEGDILNCWQIESNCEVVFGCYSTMKDDWGVEEKSPKFCVLWSDKSGYSKLNSERFEVIGNIYENPELLTNE